MDERREQDLLFFGSEPYGLKQHYTCIFEDARHRKLIWCVKGFVDDFTTSPKIWERQLVLPRLCPERYHKQILQRVLRQPDVKIIPPRG